ncbi:Protein phosphatase 1 regulatory subunit 27 [Aphelenchoides fujianensis]|nr:Protein phosphatase 1 regulatory subunit 27 [Aphelenchoides fujianensis]
MIVVQLAKWLRPDDPPNDLLRRRYKRAAATLSNSFTLQVDRSDAAYLYTRYKTIERSISWLDYLKQPALIFASLNLWRYTYTQLMEQYVAKVRTLGIAVDESTSDPEKRSGFAKGPSTMNAPEEDEAGTSLTADESRLVDAIREKDMPTFERMLNEQTARVFRPFNGLYLLHYAADIGNLEAVRLLLRKGADVNQKDEDGQTALHYAATNEFVDIVKCLIEAGADPSIRCNDGMTAADQTSNPEITRCLSK